MKNTDQRLRILFIEDEPVDIELVEIKLIQEDFNFDFEIVDNKDDFIKYLNDFNPDIVISDFSMPVFNGLDALKLSKSINPDLPFIILTNSQSEEIAVMCLKEGATDYVLKSNLTKLPFSIREAMEQVDLKRFVIKAEKDLIDNEEKYRNLVEISPDGLFITQNEEIVFVNNSAKEILKAESKDDLIGRNIRDFFPESHNRKNEEELKIVFTNPKAGNLLESRFLNLNREVVDVELRAASFTYNGKPSVQVIISNISQRKLTEAYLRQNQKLETLGQIAAGLAHQINTPLAVISMRLQLLEDYQEFSENSFFLKQMGVAKDNLNKITWLTKRMLGFARKTDNSTVEVNLNELIISIEAFLENMLKKANVSIEKDLGEISIVKIEPQMLEQAIINVITNAIDSMPGGGLIKVFSRNKTINEHKFVSIKIVDEGEGMTREEKLNLFEPFFTTKTSDKGTGLGMFISYNILKEIGGNIEVESSKGIGTRIVLNLPV